jgi:hypothetical protein
VIDIVSLLLNGVRHALFDPPNLLALQ